MKITILDGNMKIHRNNFEEEVDRLSLSLKETHTVNCFHLEEMQLKYCTGCWNCWLKTPGKCEKPDKAHDIFRSIISSDFVLFASPLNAGFTSSELKKITERTVALLHPYFEIRNKEIHHRKRYDNYPDFGLLLAREPDTDEEDIRIVSDIYDRFAINFHARKRFLTFIDQNNVEELIYATQNI